MNIPIQVMVYIQVTLYCYFSKYLENLGIFTNPFITSMYNLKESASVLFIRVKPFKLIT